MKWNFTFTSDVKKKLQRSASNSTGTFLVFFSIPNLLSFNLFRSEFRLVLCLFHRVYFFVPVCKGFVSKGFRFFGKTRLNFIYQINSSFKTCVFFSLSFSCTSTFLFGYVGFESHGSGWKFLIIFNLPVVECWGYPCDERNGLRVKCLAYCICNINCRHSYKIYTRCGRKILLFKFTTCSVCTRCQSYFVGSKRSPRKKDQILWLFFEVINLVDQHGTIT